MATLNRVHGRAATGAFYGYSPLVIKITESGKFTADTVNGTTGAITDGGYAIATKVLETFASIVWLGGQAANTFVAIIDGPSANQGDGTGGSGTTTGFGALNAALVAALGAGTYTITSATVLAGDGTFTGL